MNVSTKSKEKLNCNKGNIVDRDIVKELEEEGSELNGKYIKLNNFLYTKAYGKLDPQQQVLLVEQKHIMADYLGVLANRLNLIKGKK